MEVTSLFSLAQQVTFPPVQHKPQCVFSSESVSPLANQPTSPFLYGFFSIASEWGCCAFWFMPILWKHAPFQMPLINQFFFWTTQTFFVSPLKPFLIGEVLKKRIAARQHQHQSMQTDGRWRTQRRVDKIKNGETKKKNIHAHPQAVICRRYNQRANRHCQAQVNFHVGQPTPN